MKHVTAEDLDFYIQAGNNYRQVSLYSHSWNSIMPEVNQDITSERFW